MELDLNETRVVVFAYPDHRWPLDIVCWYEQLQKKWPKIGRTSLAKKNQVCARNHAIESSLKTHYNSFIFCDADVKPVWRTDSFLALETDVKCCQMEHRSRFAWTDPTSFHDGLWFTTREVLEAIEPPWFHHTYNHQHTEMLHCICHSFAEKAKAAGFTISHGGWAEHEGDKSWC
jgi:hypothetical protein